MYANTCWGFLGLAVTLWLAVLGLPSDSVWLAPYFMKAGSSCAIISLLLFGWLPARKLWRQSGIVLGNAAAIPYREWKGLNEIDLNTAAAIWAGTRDESNTVRHLRFRALKQAIHNGQLKAHKIKDGNVDKDTTVKPSNLHAFLKSPKAQAQYDEQLNSEMPLSPALDEGTPREKISILELIDLADEKYGWRCKADDSVHSLDLVFGLRQAGINGEITFVGRRNRYSPDITHREPLLPIDALHWYDYELDPLKAIQTHNNADVWSWKKIPVTDWAGGYADVHANKAHATTWLKQDAEQYKGHTKVPSVPSGPEPQTSSAEDAVMRTLLTPGWILHFNISNPKARKEISFNPDGTVGKGRNANEFTWRINDGLLEITRLNGDLQNFFRYDKKTDRFVCTNDPRKKGLPDQIIHRVGRSKDGSTTSAG